MNYLHLLSESDNDDLFYLNCLNKLTGKSFELLSAKRLRKSGGISELRKKLGIFFRDIKHTGTADNIFFLVVYDNDRSPVHPDHGIRSDHSQLPKKDQQKNCRYCEIQSTAQNIFGTNKQQWPIKGAIAIPVEMLESWQLLICKGEGFESEKDLPIFSRKTKSGAQYYHSSKKPPDQLKDLVKQERIRLEMSPQQFCVYCAQQLNVNDLKARSRSFTQLSEQVADW